jgi:uncharacterized protein YcaQ
MQPERLRLHAIAQSLFVPTTLKAAVRRLGFVQADPIRSPARAQDLILRHRVNEYRAGDLERCYAALDLEEDILYAYGFIHRSIWQLLHPRKMGGLSKFQKKVLAVVEEFGATHPRNLEAHFGTAVVVNAWGGYSKATTHALEQLHYRGLVRVARREKGIRIYEAAPPPREDISSTERLRKLVVAVASILAPVPEMTLNANITRYRALGNTRTVVRDLLKSGELEKEIVDGVPYLWPHSSRMFADVPQNVRFLAPFDPLVWDRCRFEHLWGWPYRFEAYTPVARRVRGYYAMPLLWHQSIIGWANARVEGSRLSVEVGFVDRRPDDSEFRSELEAEVHRLERSLKLTS